MPKRIILRYLDWVEESIVSEEVKVRNRILVQSYLAHLYDSGQLAKEDAEYNELKEKAERLDKLLESNAGANLDRLIENSRKLGAIREILKAEV